MFHVDDKNEQNQGKSLEGITLHWINLAELIFTNLPFLISMRIFFPQILKFRKIKKVIFCDLFAFCAISEIFLGGK